MTKKDETTENGPILKALTDQEATALCAELREELVRDVSRTGGHLASNLGAVELTVAIHRGGQSCLKADYTWGVI